MIHAIKHLDPADAFLVVTVLCIAALATSLIALAAPLTF